MDGVVAIFMLLYLAGAVICFTAIAVVGAYAIFLAIMFLTALVKFGMALSRYTIQAIRDSRRREL